MTLNLYPEAGSLSFPTFREKWKEASKEYLMFRQGYQPPLHEDPGAQTTEST